MASGTDDHMTGRMLASDIIARPAHYAIAIAG